MVKAAVRLLDANIGLPGRVAKASSQISLVFDFWDFITRYQCDLFGLT